MTLERQVLTWNRHIPFWYLYFY